VVRQQDEADFEEALATTGSQEPKEISEPLEDNLGFGRGPEERGPGSISGAKDRMIGGSKKKRETGEPKKDDE